MESKLDQLFSVWYHLGAAVLISNPDFTVRTRKPEEVIAKKWNFISEAEIKL